MLRSILIGVLLAAVPATASAAPFGELPFRSAGGAAACLAPTGKPGELVRWVRGGVEVMEARADGLHATGGAALGTYWSCPVVASDASGAAVLAAALEEDGLRVALREPGSTRWGAPLTLPVARYQDVEVAVSPRGDVVIAWLEYKSETSSRTRVRAVRRAPGGSFGAVETLGPFRAGWDDGVEVGVSAGGEAIVAYSEPASSDRNNVVVRIGAPGAPFGAPRTLVGGRGDPAPAVAVAPDGRALVAVGGMSHTGEVYERAPGGEFGPAQPIELGPTSRTPLLALRADGAAVVASAEDWTSPLVAVTRGAPGAFGPRVELVPGRPRRENGPMGFGFNLPEANPPLEPYPESTVGLGADGRALLVRPTDERDERDPRGLQAVTFPAAGPRTASAGQLAGTALAGPAHPRRLLAVERTTLGGGIRDAAGFSPLTLADGRFAVAWSDDRGRSDSGPRDGRLHLAIDGARVAPEPAVPVVTAGVPERRALRPAQPLLLPVRCTAACDVRVVVPDHPPGMDFTGSLPRAGTMTLRIVPANKALAPRRGRLRLTLHTSAPAGRTVQRRTVAVSLRRLPAPPLPRVSDLRARRVGDDIVMRWQADVPLRDAFLFVAGTRGPSLEDDEGAVIAAARRLPGLRFSARLKRAARARYVHVYVYSFVPRRSRSTRLSVPLT